MVFRLPRSRGVPNGHGASSSAARQPPDRGHRARAAAPLKVVDPRGKEGDWIAAAGDAEDGGPGTDFHAVMQGYVSITPLQLDRTFSDAFSSLDGWLEALN